MPTSIVPPRNKIFLLSTKLLIDCILDSNHVHDWAYTEVSELHGSAKVILVKVLTFWIAMVSKNLHQETCKCVPQIKFTNEFDSLVETK